MATEKTAAGLVAYAKAQLGCPYWYGTFGFVATQALLNDRKKHYPTRYTRLADYQRDIRQGRRVYDCVGLIKGYLWSETPSSKPKYNAAQDVSANGMKLYCKTGGPIAGLPEAPGALVFMKDHVGVYIGGRQAIEARGGYPAYAVVQTKLSERPWATWGKLNWISYAAQEPELQIGDLVRFKEGCTAYYPGGPALPAYVKTGDPYKVAQVLFGGKPVVKGAAACVLLDKRVNPATGKEGDGINTWTAVDCLERA
jgi:hypothetical protein